MEDVFLKPLVRLRLAVGCAGEQASSSWWKSEFCSLASEGFLGPVFPRSSWTARLRAVSDAAARIHDERIGVGHHVYHLFRLPEHLEQSAADLLRKADFCAALSQSISSSEACQCTIAEVAERDRHSKGEGPIRVGNIAMLLEPATLRAVAAAYQWAFTSGSRVYPYLDEPS